MSPRNPLSPERGGWSMMSAVPICTGVRATAHEQCVSPCHLAGLPRPGLPWGPGSPAAPLSGKSRSRYGSSRRPAQLWCEHVRARCPRRRRKDGAAGSIACHGKAATDTHHCRACAGRQQHHDAQGRCQPRPARGRHAGTVAPGKGRSRMQGFGHAGTAKVCADPAGHCRRCPAGAGRTGAASRSGAPPTR